jgi:hypothetical protein
MDTKFSTEHIFSMFTLTLNADSVALISYTDLVFIFTTQRRIEIGAHVLVDIATGPRAARWTERY